MHPREQQHYLHISFIKIDGRFIRQPEHPDKAPSSVGIAGADLGHAVNEPEQGSGLRGFVHQAGHEEGDLSTSDTSHSDDDILFGLVTNEPGPKKIYQKSVPKSEVLQFLGSISPDLERRVTQYITGLTGRLSEPRISLSREEAPTGGWLLTKRLILTYAGGEQLEINEECVTCQEFTN